MEKEKAQLNTNT